MKSNNRMFTVAMVLAAITAWVNWAEARPNWKIPLEGGYNYKVTVGYNGIVYDGGSPDPYHRDSQNGYYAIDFDNPTDQPEPKVLAAAAGTVIKIYDDPLTGYGYGVKLNHGDGYESLYGHFKEMPSVTKDQNVLQGQVLGVMGSSGNSTGTHLHYVTYYNGQCLSTVPESKPEPLSGYIDIKVNQQLTSDNYLVGSYSDGFHADGSSQAFIDAFNQHYPEIGWPADNNGGGVYVHAWASRIYPDYSVWIQDFQGDMSAGAEHFGEDGQSAIILSDYLPQKLAFLVKEGFWGYYKENNGQYELGVPFTEEITGFKYAVNDQPNSDADPVKAGDEITVQKFYRTYGDQRRTLVYNSKFGVLHFPVGEFSIGTDFGLEGEQVYIYVDGPLANDIPWPNETQKIPTGKWFTKPGDYNFVRHVDGQKVGVLPVHINEGNYQLVDGVNTTPKNLAATAETSDSIRLAFTLPAGLIGYNIRVYQDGVKIADTAAAESYLVGGLSPNTGYCFRVSAVDNTSSKESVLSAEACATTPSPSQGFTFNRTTICKNVDPDSPYDPIDETTVFYNSNNAVYSWIELDNVYGTHNIKWRWYDCVSGHFVLEDSYNITDPAGGWYKAWNGINLNNLSCFGSWQVKVYIDDNLVADDSFSLAPSAGYTVNWTATCKGLNPDSLYDPANRQTTFYNSNGFVYAWVELGNVYGTHKIKWKWFDPNGDFYGLDFNDTADLNGEAYRARGLLDVSSGIEYGQWRVKTYIDGELEAEDGFTMAPPVSYSVNRIAICKNSDPNSPYDPADEADVFYNSNGFVHVWVELGNVYGTHNLKWRWFDPDWKMVYEDSLDTADPSSEGRRYWERYESRRAAGIAVQRKYGNWRVRIYVDNNPVADRSFSLIAPPPIAVTFHMARDGPTDLLVTVSGLTNSSYTVQSATDIMGPWTDYITVEGGTDGIGAFTVPGALPARFFK